MTERESTILDLTVWALLIYLTTLLVLHAWRRYIRSGDVVAEAQRATAQANRLISQQRSIDSWVTNWLERPKHSTHISEAMYVERTRSHPRKGRR